MGRNAGCEGVRGAVAMTEVARSLQTEAVFVEEAQTGRLVILTRTLGEKRFKHKCNLSMDSLLIFRYSSVTGSAPARVSKRRDIP